MSTAVKLAHSATAFAKGITQRYVGPLDEDTWAQRLEVSKPTLFDIQMSSTAQKETQLRTDDVVAECKKLGVKGD